MGTLTISGFLLFTTWWLIAVNVVTYSATFCRLGLSVLYLCTHDKQDFYRHLGYQFCSPVLSFGSASNILSERQVNALIGIKMSTICFDAVGWAAGRASGL